MLTAILLAAMTESAALPDSAPVAPRPLERRLELQLDPGAVVWSGSLLTKLELRGATRELRLEPGGVVVSRVEMTDRLGRVELAWGTGSEGELRIEARRAVEPGTAWLDVAFDGEWRAAPPGVARDSARARARLERGEGVAFPAWPGRPATPWTLLVHAPRACEVRASAPRVERTEARGWRAWTFRTRGAVPGDSLRVSVRRAPRPAR